MSKVQDFNNKLKELSVLNSKKSNLIECIDGLNHKNVFLEKYQEELTSLIAYMKEYEISEARFFENGKEVVIYLKSCYPTVLSIHIMDPKTHRNILIRCECIYSQGKVSWVEGFHFTDNTVVFVEEYINVFKSLMSGLDAFKIKLLECKKQEMLDTIEDYNKLIAKQKVVLANLDTLLEFVRQMEEGR